MKPCFFMLAVLASLSLLACGGSSNSGSTGASGGTTPPVPVTYTIGGTVSGLTGSGLVLQDNSSNNLPISTSQTSFTFTTPISSGATYQVTVLTQPSSPAQTCAVTSGGPAPASANVTSIQVACTTTPTFTIGGTISGLSGTGLVLQDNGANNLTVSPNQTSFTFATPLVTGGTYNVTVLTQPTNPAQTCVVTGGGPATVTANVNNVQIACVGEWTWMGGSNVISQLGIYGTRYTGGSSNIPGARVGAVTWTDRSGNFWLFGGYGFDSAGTLGVLNDLWKYSAGEWTWLSGSNLAEEPGIYGVQGSGSVSNTPGAREYAAGWIDASGSLWLFGGVDVAEFNSYLYFNDLWKYSAGEWTWIGGSNSVNQPGAYGTLGMAAPGNIPGARSGAVGWTDTAGNMWLFGGSAAPNQGVFEFNDLWKYSANEWTWESGSSDQDQAGAYGTLGTASPSNTPGGRGYAVGWSDASGNFWLFGGQGRDSTQNYGDLNDLWKFSAGDWIWMGGSDLAGQSGTYGTLGIGAQSNVPPPRCCADNWSDASGNLWLLGGQGVNPFGYGGFNDLWRYNAAEWTWMGGSNTFNQPGIYGTLGITVPGNVPGERYSSATWTDASGNLWLFGGYASDSTGALGYLNDLWEYQP